MNAFLTKYCIVNETKLPKHIEHIRRKHVILNSRKKSILSNITDLTLGRNIYHIRFLFKGTVKEK